MKFYTAPVSHNCRRVAALIEELGLKVEEINVDLFKGETRTEAFRAINPTGKVPALVDGDLHLFESNAIMVYLAEKAGSPLWPADLALRATARCWMAWQYTTFSPPVGAVITERMIKPMVGGQTDEAKVEAGLAQFAKAAATLDAHLEGKQWICGDVFTVADYALGAVLAYAHPAGLPVSDFPAMAAWLGRVTARPAWAASAPKR
jgi:glutathione S-transferase